MSKVDINKDQIDLVLSAVMAELLALKPSPSTKPMNFWHFSGGLTEGLDNITVESLNRVMEMINNE